MEFKWCGIAFLNLGYSTANNWSAKVWLAAELDRLVEGMRKIKYLIIHKSFLIDTSSLSILLSMHVLLRVIATNVQYSVDCNYDMR